MNYTEFGIENMTLLGHRSDRVHVLQPPQNGFARERKNEVSMQSRVGME
jgi:hypothetical protein